MKVIYLFIFVLHSGNRNIFVCGLAVAKMKHSTVCLLACFIIWVYQVLHCLQDVLLLLKKHYWVTAAN